MPTGDGVDFVPLGVSSHLHDVRLKGLSKPLDNEPRQRSAVF